MYLHGAWQDAALIRREDMQAGDSVAGPAVVVERHATTVIEPGWQAKLTALNHLVLAAHCASLHKPCRWYLGGPDSIEVFNNFFMNIAEQMGLQLQNTAHSVNIKERLDFSCAIFNQARRVDCQCPAHACAFGLYG
jgi:5-oxoprolinase (ATP-hydrolysing)